MAKWDAETCESPLFNGAGDVDVDRVGRYGTIKQPALHSWSASRDFVLCTTNTEVFGRAACRYVLLLGSHGAGIALLLAVVAIASRAQGCTP